MPDYICEGPVFFLPPLHVFLDQVIYIGKGGAHFLLSALCVIDQVGYRQSRANNTNWTHTAVIDLVDYMERER